MIKKTVSVQSKIARLASMKKWELEEKFEDLFGFPAGKTTPVKLRARLAYRIQEIYLGGLSKEDLGILEQTAAQDPMANFHFPKGHGRVPRREGTQLRRVWHNVEYVVTILGEGVFEYNGEKYTSLSRIAKEITGGHWNGKLFFGVK